VFSADAGNSVGEIVGMTKAINSVDFKSTRPFRAITGSEDNAVSYFEGPPFKWKTTMSVCISFIKSIFVFFVSEEKSRTIQDRKLLATPNVFETYTS